jgi:hypothetical protein
LSIPAGSTQGTVNIVTSPVSQDASVTITAVHGNAIRVVNVSLRAPAVLKSFQVSPDSVLSGSPASLQITLNHALGASTVSLSSNNNSLITVPASASVSTGQVTVTVPVTAGNGSGLVTVTATLGAVSLQDELRVNGAPIVPGSVTPGIASAGPNTQVPFTLTLKGQASAGGLVVQLSSSHPSLVSMPGSVVVPAGQTSTTFNVLTLAPGSATVVTITASLNFKSAQGTITITP